MATDLVEADEWTATVTVPEDGDDYDAASVEVPFQSLANRTVRLNSRIDQVPDEAHTWAEAQTFEGVLGMAGADNEISYQPFPRTRTIILPPTSACPRMDDGGIKLTGAGVTSPFGWVWMAAGNELIYSFRLPHAAILQRVRVGVTGGSDGTDVSVHCYQVESIVDSIAAGSTVLHDLGSTTKPRSGAWQLVTHTVPAPITTNGAWHTYAIDVTLQTVAGVCAWVEIQFLDPGPRNF